MTDEKAWAIELQAISDAFARLRDTLIPDADAADVSGQLLALERRIGEWRRGLEREVLAEDEHVEGQDYRLVPTLVTVREFNDARILRDAAEALNTDLVGALRSALDAKAVTLKWGIRNLTKWLKGTGVVFATAFTSRDELPADDLNAPHVWETTKDGPPDRVPIKDDGRTR